MLEAQTTTSTKPVWTAQKCCPVLCDGSTLAFHKDKTGLKRLEQLVLKSLILTVKFFVGCVGFWRWREGSVIIRGPATAKLPTSASPCYKD